MTWLRANTIPPRCWQLPVWMCETCDELAGRPVILSSTVMSVAPVKTTTVPLAVTPASGDSLNVMVVDAGGDGDGVAAASPPHAATQRTIATVATHAPADGIAARHRAIGITPAGYWSGAGFLSPARNLALRVARGGRQDPAP